MMVVFNSRYSIRNNRYDYESEATWRSFQISTDPVVISFNSAHNSGIGPQGRTAEDAQAGNPSLLRSSSISTDEVSPNTMGRL